MLSAVITALVLLVLTFSVCNQEELIVCDDLLLCLSFSQQCLCLGVLFCRFVE